MPDPATTFARCSPLAARVLLAVLGIFLACSAAITFSPYRTGYAEKARFEAPSDIDLYNAEIARLREGQGYYEAAGLELRQRGYPTGSLFNWRTPLPMWLIAHLPAGGGKALLGILAAATIGATFLLLTRERSLAAGTAGAVLQFGALMPCFLGELHAMPDLWAGTLIGLSACLYGLGHPRGGLTAGLAAVFMRELAGLYCVVCLAVAVQRRRWREVGGWLIGLGAYFAFFAWHAAQVAGQMRPDDLVHVHGWVQLGGLPFVISTAQMNVFLLLLPQWATAVYLTAALLGVAGWRPPASLHVGLGLAAYVMLFSAVGQDFNQYWGTLIMPLYCLGAAASWPALRDLWQAARSNPPIRGVHRVHDASAAPAR